MKELFYSIESSGCKIECFKLLDRDENKEPGYEIVCTYNETGKSASVEAYQPQAAITLADETMRLLES